jgi:hypothetical protein
LEVVRLDLMRRAELSGRVIDEAGRPVPRLIVEGLNPISSTRTSQISARTGQDGTFKMSGILPGQYIVRISTGMPLPPPAFDFTDADLDTTDQEIVEASYCQACGMPLQMCSSLSVPSALSKS